MKNEESYYGCKEMIWCFVCCKWSKGDSLWMQSANEDEMVSQEYTWARAQAEARRAN